MFFTFPEIELTGRLQESQGKDWQAAGCGAYQAKGATPNTKSLRALAFTFHVSRYIPCLCRRRSTVTSAITPSKNVARIRPLKPRLNHVIKTPPTPLPINWPSARKTE